MPLASQNQPGFRNHWKRDKRPVSVGYQLIVAVALISFGALLFLDNVGILPVERIYVYWPVIPIVLGVSKLIYRPTIVSVLWSSFFILVGFGFLLVNLNILHLRNDGTWPLALLLITFGFAALVKTVDRAGIASRQKCFPGFAPWTSTDILNETVFMASLKRKVESANFLGGEIHNIMGNVELDLRGVQLPPGAKSATVEVECTMGVIKIRIHETWRVSVQAQGILGNVEDKTIPPRDKSEDAPTLIITGTSTMGNVELEN